MKTVFFIIVLWIAETKVFGQVKFEWTYYYGSDTSQVVRKLKNYIAFFNYRGMLYKTDSTIELEVTHDSSLWRIFSVFYFDRKGKCYSFSNTRCDKYGPIQFNHLVANKEYKWRKISENTYLSKFSKSEMLYSISNDSCLLYRRTKLSRKEYNALRSSSK